MRRGGHGEGARAEGSADLRRGQGVQRWPRPRARSRGPGCDLCHARIEIQTRDALELKDKIARALAILQTCRVLSPAETLALFSAMRLGVDIGYIDGLKRDTISLLTFELGRAYLDWIGVRDDLGINQHEFRAARVRDVFAEAKFVA